MDLYHVVKENGQLSIESELQFDGKEYFTCEYNKIKKRMTQIGVVIDYASCVVVLQFDKEVARLTLDEESGIWFHEQKKWIKNNYIHTTDSIFGINAGGSFIIVSYDENDIEIDRVTVNITPGTMSIDEYKQMQQEVRRLFEVFSYDLTNIDHKEENFLRRVQLPLYPQQQFEKILEQFVEYTNEIIKMPEQDLIQMEKKVSLFQVKKWTPSIIIENEIKQNGKVTASINEKTTDIKEHRMLRFMVEEFKQRIERELFAEQKQLFSLQDELEQLKDAERKETSSLAANFRKLIEIITLDCEKLKIRIENWLKMQKIIDDLLLQSLLQCESQLIEETHLFRMNPYYSEVFTLYNEYEQLSPVLSDTFRLFIQSILKSPTLYEIWILLKIIQQLSQWDKYIPYEFIQDLIKDKYVDSTSISGYRKRFNFLDKPFDIVLYYDYTIGEKGYRPDFVIGFLHHGKQKWHLHTLDAKYKCYSKMNKGEKRILHDLKRSGTRYLNELFTGNPNVLLHSATLVHPDVGSVNWNVMDTLVNPKRLSHKLAHFYLTPNKSTNIEIYLKRLLHEGSHFKSCCPSCGKEVKEKKMERKKFSNKRGFKLTYICIDCDVVWVASFCSSCFYNGQRMKTIEKDNEVLRLARPLYKYSHNNYNLQVEDKWDVHCPTCNNTVNHRIKYITKEDIFKGTIILGKNSRT